MKASQGISKALEIEDSLMFYDETLACYKHMLKRDRGKRRFENESSREQRSFSQASLECSKKDLSFEKWLKAALQEEEAVSAVATELGSFEMEANTSPSVSVMTNYDKCIFSSCSSIGKHSDCGLFQDNDTFQPNFGKCDYYLIPLKDDNSLKSRTGSWSDSGYCCDKSDSENSRFSSLSFSECLNAEDCYNPNSCAGEFSVENELYLTETESSEDVPEEYNDLFVGMQILGNSHGIKEPMERVFETEHYSAEELKILRELMSNPENFHETTKELSDIARDVSSKGWRRKRSKTIGQFFRRIVGNLKKLSSEKNKLKPAAKEFECGNDYTEKHQRKFSLRTCSSPFRKRSSSVKTPKKTVFSIGKGNKNTMQRANSYSSLFGRRGSLFSQTERNQNCYMVKRSKSYDTIRNEIFVDNRNDFENLQIEALTANFDMACTVEEKSQVSMNGCHARCDDDFSYEAATNISSNSSCDDVCRNINCYELVAPLTMNISEERSALTRKIKKLRDV